jgi:hypothetical protein
MNLRDTHISAAIWNGGQLLLKQAMPGKSIFHAQVTFPNGDGAIGKIALSEDGALQNLEDALALEAAG